MTRLARGGLSKEQLFREYGSFRLLEPFDTFSISIK